MTRLLVADDDATIRKTLERGLTTRGYDVTSVKNGIEALEVLRSESVDLVVTDINMPSMDGIELLIQLVEHRPGMKVIAISGGGLFPKNELLTDARLLGAVEVLEKPFDIETLFELIESALGGGDDESR